MDLSGLWKILLNVLDQQWEFIQREEAKKKKNSRKIYPKRLQISPRKRPLFYNEGRGRLRSSEKGFHFQTEDDSGRDQ